MLDQSTRSGRIIAAALKLGEGQPWQDISVQDIAGEAGASLGDLREEFSSKMDILAAFSRAADAAVLKKMAAEADGADTLRDRLFDTVMTRLEVMTPHKPALKRIMADVQCRNILSETLVRQALASQYWMLNAAGMSAEGAMGAARRAGLLSVYRSVLLVWLDDDDPGLAKTMAVLDRKLRNGETWLKRADAICSRFATILTRGKPAETEKAPPEDASQNEPDIPPEQEPKPDQEPDQGPDQDPSPLPGGQPSAG